MAVKKRRIHTENSEYINNKFVLEKVCDCPPLFIAVKSTATNLG